MITLEPDHQEFLDRRFFEWVTQQPEAVRLRDRLLQEGGLAIVAPPNNMEPDLSRLLSEGLVLRAPARLVETAENSCHRNVAKLYEEKADSDFKIGTGYGLTEGLWRQHSWALVDGVILETTSVREIYFGLLLEGDAADFFSFCNS